MLRTWISDDSYRMKILCFIKRLKNLIGYDSFLKMALTFGVSFVSAAFIYIVFGGGDSFVNGGFYWMGSFVLYFALSIFFVNKLDYFALTATPLRKGKNIYPVRDPVRGKFFKRFLFYHVRACFIIVVYFAIYYFICDFMGLMTVIYCEGGDEIEQKQEVNPKNSCKEATESTDKDVLKISEKKEYYNFKISKDLVDNGVKNGVELTKIGLKHVVPNVGAGAAAAGAASATAKATAGMPLGARVVAIGSSAAAAGLGAKLGIGAADRIMDNKNLDLKDWVNNSPHANPDHDNIPSPISDMINSPLEDFDLTSPLQDLLMYSFLLDLLILILLISLLVIIFYRYVLYINLNFVTFLLDKYFSIKLRNWLNKYIIPIKDRGIDFNSKFVLIMFVLNTITLVMIVLLKIFITSEIYMNINSYVNVHNLIHFSSVGSTGSLGEVKNSCILLFIGTGKLLYNTNMRFSFRGGVIENYFVNTQSQSQSHTQRRYIGNESYVNDKNVEKIDVEKIDVDKIDVDKIDVDMIEKNNLFELPFDWDNRFGQYSKFLGQKVSLEFMEEYYPEFIDNELFIYFLNQLSPIVREEVSTISNLFDLINNLNTTKDKLILYTTVLPKDVTLKLFENLSKFRKEIIEILVSLNLSNKDIDKLLVNLGSKLNLTNGLGIQNNWTEYVNNIVNSNEFEECWFKIYEILSDKLKLSEEIINADKELFIGVLSLIIFCRDNNIYSSSSSSSSSYGAAGAGGGGTTAEVGNVYSIKPLKDFMLVLEELSKSELTKTVKTKKNKVKTVRVRPGEINSVIKFSLKNIKLDLEDLIKNALLIGVEDTKLLENLKSDVERVNKEKEDFINNDYKYLLENFGKASNLIEFLYDISKDLSDENIGHKHTKIMDYIFNAGMNIDDLYYFTNLFHSIKFDSNLTERQNVLSIDSNFFVKCKDIIYDEKIKDNKQKQLILERFILSYEKEFISNLINNIDNSLNNYKLISRIYKHSTPHFNNRIEAIIKNHLNRNLELYNKNKNNHGKIGDNLALALFLVLEVKDISNILFSKVIRIIANSGGIKQTQLIGQLADEMCIVFKHNSNLDTLKDKLTIDKLTIIKEVKDSFDSLPLDSKLQFGILLYELLMNEFSYIFKIIKIYEDYESHLYVTISKEYIAVLSRVIFNPIKLPMLCEPNKWYNGKSGNIGGYLLEEFNELNKNNELVRSNPYLKDNSVVSNTQILSVNYLNNVPFIINNTMLEFLLFEWKKENSLIFKIYNKLHPLTLDLENITDSNTRLEIIQHNSHYWNYANTINIALLMKDQTIYLPTFLDFRGRVYPTPNYLNYQGGDIARSLLLFKEVGKIVNYDSNVRLLLDNQTTKKLISSKLNDIDYVKLYLANVYGLNKLSRKQRIKWFDDNINEILDLLNNNRDSFFENYLMKAKEPAQFISCLFQYNSYLNKEISEIKTPILFDATCSGIQHLSALTTDLDISKLVNLVETAKDEPSDFYKFCIDNINFNLKNLPEDYSIFKNKILKLDLNRKILKHPIMTVPYNVTAIGIADKLANHFSKKFITVEESKELVKNKKWTINIKDENLKNGISKANSKNLKGFYAYYPSTYLLKKEFIHEDKDLIFSQKELNTLGIIIRGTVLSLIPPFAQLKEYFDKILDILKIINLPIYWETPSNMTVSMSLINMSQKKIKSSLLKSSKPITILLPTNNLNYRSIKTGLMPNFIHSLDASNIHLLIKLISVLNLNTINLYTIHDCFATDYKNMAILEVLIKQSFSDIYFNQNYLNSIHNSFVNQINSVTTVFSEALGENKEYILIDSKLIPKSSNKLLSFFKEKKLVKIYLPKLPEYKWSVNKDILKKEIFSNNYFIS
uniref:DNA-directed RNA polymerase n=1 Tax=Calocybe cyanea TaxID=181965 RepID=A0A8F1D644_9AGAR|nr:RNA polymerase [Calocybe cyanea]